VCSRAVLPVVGLVAAIGCVKTPAPALAAWFDHLHARGLFDGAVVVSRGDAVVLAKGYGFANVEARVPFTPDTPADAASLAKTFTAAVVLELVADHRLDLDAPVQRWLPELPYPAITLRHLLSHASGLPSDYAAFDRFVPPGTVRTTELLVRTLAEQHVPLELEPGTRFVYSSFGYDVAALVAARAANTTVHELFEQRVFARWGLRSAFLRPGRFADWPGIRTRGYPEDVFDNEAFVGGSNIYISARDLDRWNRTFFRRASTDPGFAHATVDEGRTGLTLLSWYRAGTAFWYLGHLQGFHALVFRDVQTTDSIVFVTNNSLEPWLHHMILRSVRALLDGGEPEPLELPRLAARASLIASELAATWRLGDRTTLTIESEGPEVFVRSATGVRYHAFPEGATRYYVPGLDLAFGFARDATGRVARVHASTQLAARWGVRQ